MRESEDAIIAQRALASGHGGLAVFREDDQLGHLVASEQSLLRALGADAPDLPDGFAEAHDKSTNGCDDADKFHTKGEYLALMDQMHQAAITAIEKTSEDDLDQLKGWLKKLGAVRANRVAPALDDKILTGWNGLMIAALAKGGRVVVDAAGDGFAFTFPDAKGQEPPV